MLVTQIQIKNFRCFTNATFDFGAPIVLIEGPNGSGKTSLLEVLYYLCYLKSFRTRSPQDLVAFEQDGFFVKASLQSDEAAECNDIQVGFSRSKRTVKVNQKSIASYKELMDHYRIVALTEDDLNLIKGGPEERRSFIDGVILLAQPSFLTVLKTYRTILDNRNALLYQGRGHGPELEVWTEKLWQQAAIIQEERIRALRALEQEVNRLLAGACGEKLSVTFTYRAKQMRPGESFEQFFQAYAGVLEEERRMRRSLFGAHLDDFSIDFQEKKSKLFASRGQQKLIVVLLKIAQMAELGRSKGPAIFLLDDFMTDFDEQRVEGILPLLTALGMQLIFTSPLAGGALSRALEAQGAHRLILTH